MLNSVKRVSYRIVCPVCVSILLKKETTTTTLKAYICKDNWLKEYPPRD